MRKQGTVKNANIWLGFVRAVAALLLFGCSMASLSGGGTEGGNVSGVFVNPDGSGSAQALVRLIPASYDPAAINQNTTIYTTATKSDGSYSFFMVPRGNYSIQAVSADRRTRSLITGITVTGEVLWVPRVTLQTPGAMKLFLPSTFDRANGYVYVPGTTIMSSLAGAGAFVIIDSVPAGKISAVYYATGTTLTPDTIRYNIDVPSGDTAVIANPAWKYARQFFLNTTPGGADITGNVTDFPLMVRLTSGTFSFSQAQTDGSDIRFAKSDSILLPYEIERWDAVNQLAEIWVKVDTVYGNDRSQSITLYWGNPAALGSSNSIEVFDAGNGFVGVWHMNENPAAGTNSIRDRTANSYNATPYGSMTAANVVDGTIGKGLAFNGSNDYLDAGAGVNLTGSYSVSLWVLLNRTNNYQRLIFQDSAYTLWYDSDKNGARMEHFDSSGTWRGIPQDGGAVLPIATGVWYYLTGTYDGDRVRLYVNGTLATETNSIGANPRCHGYDLIFGEAWNTSYVNGIMDEIRIERTARSGDWIKLSYMNQRSNDMLVVFK